MRDLPPALPVRVYRKLCAISLWPTFRAYVSRIDADHPFSGFPARLVGDASSDPSETFDHYDAFASWASKVLAAKPEGLSILDLGSPKMMNAMLAARHRVTAIVLRDCGDPFSGVHYVVHDVADPLPFDDASFDFFTSAATMPLIGLGRYGDKVDATSLPRLLSELRRVTRPAAECMISLCLGPNYLAFNNAWFFDFPTIARLLSGWKIEDFVVDRWSSPRTPHRVPSRERFSKDTSLAGMGRGDYCVIILHCKRIEC
jgi:SAM-dependent methyltransferase